MKTLNNYKSISKDLKTKSDCPGIRWKEKKDKDNGDGDFDLKIVPLLKLLNNNTLSWHTTASCEGHSEAYLKNPRRGYGSSDTYRMAIYIHVHNSSIKNFMNLIRAWDNVSDCRLWCNLGYRDDYSNLVEKNYIPFEIIVSCRTKPVRDRLLKKYEDITRVFIEDNFMK